jgi:hypothetical protein
MRPTNFIDITGQRFGRWTVVAYFSQNKWICRCDCGSDRVILSQNLRRGASKSCGCLANELSAKRRFIHGLSNTREFSSWRNMMQRCNNKKYISYERYGGRGIVVCSEWFDFKNFLSDMGPIPSSRHSIDRINNDGMYSKENCKWATMEEQSLNKKNTRYISLNGRMFKMAEISKLCGIPTGRIASRIRAGWAEEDAVKIPVSRKNKAKRKAP